MLLEIIISDSLQFYFLFALAIIILFLWSEFDKAKKNRISLEEKLKKSEINFIHLTNEAIDSAKDLTRKVNETDTLRKTQLTEKELLFENKVSELKVAYQNWAIEELEKFKKTEIERLQKAAENNAISTAKAQLQKWKIEEEAKIRADAIKRSYSVNLGKITEHLVPFHQAFLSQFNPKDARFIGSPIDLVVFDGYSDKRDDIIIYFVEIKTGGSKLTSTQKLIKESVMNAEVRWAEINPDNENIIDIANNNLSKNNSQPNLFD